MPVPHDRGPRQPTRRATARNDPPNASSGKRISENGVLVTMFAAKATSTWTLALTDPWGTSCIVAEGTGFELMPEALTLRGDPAPT